MYVSNVSNSVSPPFLAGNKQESYRHAKSKQFGGYNLIAWLTLGHQAMGYSV